MSYFTLSRRKISLTGSNEDFMALNNKVDVDLKIAGVSCNNT